MKAELARRALFRVFDGHKQFEICDRKVLVRERIASGEPMVETIALERELLRYAPLWVTLKSTRLAAPGCGHGSTSGWQVLGGIDFRDEPSWVHWLTSQRAEILRRLDQLTKKAARDARGRRAGHEAIERQTERWWSEHGHRLHGRDFQLTRVRGVLTFHARDHLEAFVAKRMRGRMNRVCLNACWQDLIVPRRKAAGRQPNRSRRL
jgi:hypothetical protein